MVMMLPMSTCHHARVELEPSAHVEQLPGQVPHVEPWPSFGPLTLYEPWVPLALAAPPVARLVATLEHDPLFKFPLASPTVPPLPSFMCQSPARPVVRNGDETVIEGGAPG